MSILTSVEQKFTQLKLGRLREVVANAIAQAEQHQLGYGEFLDELLAEELLGRHEHQIQRKLKQAGFPYAATLEQFDWQARPKLKRAVMMRYFDSAFVEKAGALILIGPSGLGKTHLAIAVGTRMAQLGYSVRFLTAQQLSNQVLTAPNRTAVAAVLHLLMRCQMLILDEFGYLPSDPQFGSVLYEVVSARYGKGATVITSNLAQLRAFHPAVRSIMMDAATLATFRSFVVAGQPFLAATLPGLDEAEQRLFVTLREQNLRLEQERIAYVYALHQLREAVF